tara:strand:- start:410 stop:1441 length:1032 start_codon:yes stop_codon:yes gene_type:complete
MKIEIKNNNNYSNKKISNFLKEAYKERCFEIYKVWNWLYKTDLNKETSLIAIKDQNIVAHAGLIPSFINLNGRRKKAGWFVDFIVDKNLQKQGIGKLLTNEWLNIGYIGLTFCNHKSYRVFKKFGWVANYNFNLHYFLLRPLNHQRIYRKLRYLKFILDILNKIYNSLFIIFIKMKIKDNDNIKIEKLSKFNISNFLSDSLTFNKVNTLRSYDYLKWRFLESPEANKYIHISYKNKYYAIVKKRTEKKFNNYLDLLIINKIDKHSDFIQFLLKIILWSSNNNLSYVKMIIPNISISNYIKKNIFTIITKPRFAFFSNQENEIEELKNSNFDFQLFDTDFEFTD